MHISRCSRHVWKQWLKRPALCEGYIVVQRKREYDCTGDDDGERSPGCLPCQTNRVLSRRWRLQTGQESRFGPVSWPEPRIPFVHFAQVNEDVSAALGAHRGTSQPRWRSLSTAR